MVETFHVERRVAFADTDAMRVTHHANYLRYCEEARVAWMRARDLTSTQYPHDDSVLAVLEYRVRHARASTFDDVLRVSLQARREGARVRFQYRVSKDGELVAEAETLHIVVDAALRAAKPGPRLIAALATESWRDEFLVGDAGARGG